ncbi:DNA fragmentation factor subunit beta [Neodiprion lecontei]|uniref:DNAation factor subunit beta n=1 Tax=Neodiprion lecontei TaxID=441921 RepID=A0A6J0C4S0_NEOLC|nr:DNA fragmentation factor subunit beta [Neodiprion lecontei]
MSVIVDRLRRVMKGEDSRPVNDEKEIKGYRVTNADRTRRFGVACKDFQELKSKACAKFNILNPDERDRVTICLVDGSVIDDEYFQSVEPQTTLILQRHGEKFLSDADILYNTLRQVNLEFITTGDAISRFLTENLKSKIAVLNKALNKNDEKTRLSSREDHPDWFKNLETTATTKEAYMHRRCQDRIRCYLYKTIDQIKTSDVYSKNESARRRLLHVMTYFKLQLKEDHCFGFYFDRSYARGVKNRLEIGRSIGEKEEEEAEKPANLSSDEADFSASVFSCHHFHCPCKIGAVSAGFWSPWNSNRFLAEFFPEENDTDETDARRISPVKKTTANDKSADLCPYEIGKNDETVPRFALCNSDGEFRCDGVWSADRCAYADRHTINPYRSYEELVLFSTWNFDHRIERSRTLIPNLLRASEEKAISREDLVHLYENIFTVKNLRLVHIVCHDKGAHRVQ